jgi:hypothetical protein
MNIWLILLGLVLGFFAIRWFFALDRSILEFVGFLIVVVICILSLVWIYRYGSQDFKYGG